jgi:hypothetical protein
LCRGSYANQVWRGEQLGFRHIQSGSAPLLLLMQCRQSVRLENLHQPSDQGEI